MQNQEAQCLVLEGLEETDVYITTLDSRCSIKNYFREISFGFKR